MLRTIFYFLIIGVLAALSAWLADNPGNVVIHWFGYEIETSVGALGVALAFLLAAGLVAVSFFRLLTKGSHLFQERLAKRKRATSGAELVRGFTAVAMGDGEAAKRALKAAAGARELQGLTRLLTAQIAELEREPKAAERAYRELMKDPTTEFLGLRGLYDTAMGEGDREAALAFATRAFEMEPRAAWVAEQLFRVQTQSGAWDLARKTIASARRTGTLSVEDSRRREGVLAAAEALCADAQGERERAFELAQKALALAPGLTPMAVFLAKEQLSRAQHWAASGTIETAWRVHPHPDLARTYAGLKPGETPVQRARRLMGLAEFNPGHVESRLLVAGEALGLGEVRRARRALRPAVDGGSARVLMLMSEIALKGGEGEAEAQAFRARAVTAPRDAQWTCRECGRERGDWVPICDACGGFGTAIWGSEGAVAAVDLVAAPAEHEALDWRGDLAEAAVPAAQASQLRDEAQRPAAELDRVGATPADLVPEAEGEIEIFVPPRQPDDPGTEDSESRAGSAYN
jgi:HemY protein